MTQPDTQEEQKRAIKKSLGYDPDDPDVSVQIVEGDAVTAPVTDAELRQSIIYAVQSLLDVLNLLNKKLDLKQGDTANE